MITAFQTGFEKVARPMNANPITGYKSLWEASERLRPKVHSGGAEIKLPANAGEAADYFLHGDHPPVPYADDHHHRSG